LTEYFEVGGGGTMHYFHKHFECAFSLDLVAHLSRSMGFGLQIMPLSEFLNIQIQHPILTRRFCQFMRDELGHSLSTTLPLDGKDLRQWTRQSSPLTSLNFLSRTELFNLLAHFYVLILTKRKKIADKDFNEILIPIHEPEILEIKSRKGENYLVTAHPLNSRKMNPAAQYLWSKVNGKRSLKQISTLLAKRYGLEADRALKDTLSCFRAFYRQHYIFFR